MRSNISVFDGILRLCIGILWAGIFGGWLTSWVGIIALYPIVTSMSGWCLIYGALKKYTTETNPYTEHERASSSGKASHQEEGKYKMTA